MLGAVVFMLLMTPVVGLLAFLWWRDRQDERALAVRAEVAHVVNRVLGGESLIAINATGARPWRRGQILLSVPNGYDWLFQEVSGSVLRRVPIDFELVVPGGEDRVSRPLAASVASVGSVAGRAA